jgi:hypothetical protein
MFPEKPKAQCCVAEIYASTRNRGVLGGLTSAIGLDGEPTRSFSEPRGIEADVDVKD